jgi:hypothetical protein
MRAKHFLLATPVVVLLSVLLLPAISSPKLATSTAVAESEPAAIQWQAADMMSLAFAASEKKWGVVVIGENANASAYTCELLGDLAPLAERLPLAFYRVDLTTDGAVAGKLGAPETPAVVILDPTGAEAARLTGRVSAEAVSERLIALAGAANR